MNAMTLLLERRQRGMTQEELARRLGLKSPGVISYWERGRRPIKAARAMEIMRALNEPAGGPDDPDKAA